MMRASLSILVLLFLVSCGGPPDVEGREAYPSNGSATFDHGLFDRVLKKVVRHDGLVNYELLIKDRADFDAYLKKLATAPFDKLGRGDKLAFLFNAYNAFTIQLILDHYPLKSIKDISSDQRWDGRKFAIAGRSWTLNTIEHEECRAKFVEPRVHFALNCASIGCPPLRREAYIGERLEEQLADQTQRVLNDGLWCSVDQKKKIISLTKLMKWYRSDFLATAASLSAFIANYRDDVTEETQYNVEFIDYDWRLNSWR